MKPSVLDRGHKMILTNWFNTKYVTCNDNHDYPFKIPSHPYVLLKRTVLCNCDIHAENYFLLESIAACPGKQSALTMYYTVYTAFMSYFENFIENLETEKLDMHISQNWTTKDQVFPISLQTSEFDANLLKAPKTLKDLVNQCKQRGHISYKSNKDNNKCSFFNNIIMDIFLFIAAILSMLVMIAITHLVCKHTKLKALVTRIAFHPIQQTEALLDNEKTLPNCTHRGIQ